MGRFILFQLLIMQLTAGYGQKSDVDSICSSGELYLDSMMYDRAITEFKRGVQFSRESGDLTNEGYFLIDIGYSYQQKGNLKVALEYYEKARVIGERTENNDILATSYLNLGIINQQKGFHEQAMPLLFKAINYSEKTGNTEFMSSAFNSLGNIHNKLDHFKLALGYYKQALKHRQKSGLRTNNSDLIHSKIDVASSLTNIGDLFKNYNQYDSAIYYLEQALSYKGDISDTQFITGTMVTLGEVYVLQGRKSDGMRLFQESYKLRKTIKSSMGIANSANLIASLSLAEDQYNKAEFFILEAIKVSKRDSINEELLISYNLARKLYRLLHLHDKALYYDDQYISLNNILFNEKSIQSLDEMEARYQNQKNEEKIGTIQQIARSRMLLLWSGIGFLIIVLAFIIRAYFQKKRDKERIKKDNERIEEDNKKIETLMRELNHRVKNNLQLLSSMLSVQAGQLKNGVTKKVLIETENRVRAMAVVHKRLYMDEALTLINVPIFINDLIEDLKVSYGRNDLTVDAELEVINISADKAIPLGLMINEILTNSFKYAFNNNPKPHLEVKLRTGNNNLILTIQDNGPGIEIELKNNKTFGFKLIDIFCKQMYGEFKVNNNMGTCVTISIKL